MWKNSHKTTGLITCTKEILNRHLKFLCSDSSSQSLYNKILGPKISYTTYLCNQSENLMQTCWKSLLYKLSWDTPLWHKSIFDKKFHYTGTNDNLINPVILKSSRFSRKKNRPIYLLGYFLCISQQITFSTFPNTYLFAKDAFYWRFLKSGSQSPCGQKFIQNEILTN